MKKKRPARKKVVAEGRRPGGATAPALSDEARQYVLTALACFAGPRHVLAGLREKFGISVSGTVPYYYRREYKEEIEALRRPWLEKLIDTLPLRHKAIRLRELAKLYQGCVRVVLPEGARTTEGLLQEVTEPPNVHLGLYERMQELLAAIRKEAGDDVQVVDLRLPIDPKVQAQLDELIGWVRRRDDVAILELYRKALDGRMLTDGSGDGKGDGGAVDAEFGPAGDEGDDGKGGDDGKE